MSGHDPSAGEGRSGHTGRVKEYLCAYLEEDDHAALTAAADLCRSSAVDVGAVLDWIGAQRADAALKARAVLAVRRAVGLPLRSGAVCNTPR